MIRRYSELVQIPKYEDRFHYLKIFGTVGESTFGFERNLNQRFYRSIEWRRLRDIVISRDEACDMAFPGYDIYDRVYVHHMNPIMIDDLRRGNDDILDPEYMISVTLNTHNAIHFGDESLLSKPLVERKANDTLLWKRS